MSGWAVGEAGGEVVGEEVTGDGWGSLKMVGYGVESTHHEDGGAANDAAADGLFVNWAVAFGSLRLLILLLLLRAKT